MNKQSKQQTCNSMESCTITRYLNLQKYLEEFYKRTIDEIYVESIQEVDIGDSKGNEIW